MATQMVHGARRQFTRYTRPILSLSDGLRAQAACVMEEAFPVSTDGGRSSKVYAPVLSPTMLSRMRHDGGPLWGMVQAWLAAWHAGDGPTKADRMLVWLQGVRDALWGDNPQDLNALIVAEQAAEGAENNATIAYMLEPSDENARRLAAAMRAEQAEQAAILAELERRHNLGRAG